ncbi:hypothetical protein M8J77_013193 [Diaphorina citri]|nr:hypothetical protein M8J77_013193 [Diaphorina citri]
MSLLLLNHPTTPCNLDAVIVVYFGLPQVQYQVMLNADGGRPLPRLHVPYRRVEIMRHHYADTSAAIFDENIVFLFIYIFYYSLAKALVIFMTVLSVLYCCPIYVDPCCLKVFYRVPTPCTQSSISTPFQKIWNYDRANWDLFRERISFDFPIDSSDIDGTLSLFNNAILAAANDAIPEKKLPPNRLPVPWWDDEIKVAIQNRRKYLRALRRHPTADNRMAFMRARAIARKMVKEKKRKGWTDFVQSVDHSMSSGELFHKMGKLRGKYSSRRISAIQDRNDRSVLHYDNSSIAEILGAHFSSVSSDENYPGDFLRHKISCESIPIVPDLTNSQDYNRPFEYCEMVNVLSCCSSKAAGPDGISFPLLKNLPTQALEKLLSFYNFIWTSGKFPSLWSLAYILPLPKPGKDHTSPSSYRPISLLSCCGKVLEKMTNKRLSWFLEKNGSLNPCQSGGRFKRSTMDNLVSLEHEVTQGLAKKEHVLASFLDVQKAFDMTWRHKILRRLLGFGVDGFMLRYLQSFLNNRKIQVKCNGLLSSQFSLKNGIVQGSSLSPLLFIVFMDDLLDVIKLPLRRHLFIDDLLITVRGKALDTITSRLQTTLNDISSWSKQNGLVFSADPGKSMCIHFSRSRNCPRPPLYYDGMRLTFVDKTKFLGLVWDSKLSWSPHIIYVKEKAVRALNILKMVGNKNYGVRRATMLQLYKSYILPIFDYGCFVYGAAKAHILNKLNPVHNSGIRIATGALRSSPIPSLLVESGVPPLQLRRSQLAMSYAVKIASCPANTTYSLLFPDNIDADIYPLNKPKPLCLRVRELALFSRTLQNSEFAPYSKFFPPWSIATPVIDNALSFDKKENVSSVVFQQRFQELVQSKYQDFTLCFTDGSKTANNTSCAYIIDKTLISSFVLNNVNSVYTSELIAVLLCLKHLKFLPKEKFVVISDSKSTLLALSNPSNTNPIVSLIHSCWTDLLCYGKQVAFLWCPSHTGIQGNEAVDRAARNPSASLPPLKLCSPEDFKPFICKLIKDLWQNSWSNIPNSNKLKSIKPVIGPWPSSDRQNRHEEVVICRMRIGHTRATHGHLFKRAPPSTCRCGEILSVQHILTCTLHGHIRASLPAPPALTDDVESVDSMLKYLKKLNLYAKI